jgi:hypothetical protein
MLMLRAIEVSTAALTGGYVAWMSATVSPTRV